MKHLITRDRPQTAGVEALIDRAWYLEAYPDVAAAGIDPAEHYMATGWAEGRWPNPLFDTEWYLARNPDVEGSGINPLSHYCNTGWREGRTPHPLFDTAWYLEHNPDVAGAGINPLTHYLQRGHFEPREPHPLFQSGEYLKAHPDVAAAGKNPLAHYIHTGWREGRKANPIFDADWYARQAKLPSGQEPLTHYVAGGSETARISPHPLFDGAWYLDQYPDVAEAGLNPLAHYLMRGHVEIRDPHPDFDTQAYFRGGSNVGQCGLPPLVQFLGKSQIGDSGRGGRLSEPDDLKKENAQRAVSFPDLFQLRSVNRFFDRILVVRIGTLHEANLCRDFVLRWAEKADIVIVFADQMNRERVEDAIGASLGIFIGYAANLSNAEIFLHLVNSGPLPWYRSVAFGDTQSSGNEVLAHLDRWMSFGHPETCVWIANPERTSPASRDEEAGARTFRARLGRKLNKNYPPSEGLSVFAVPGFVASEIKAMGISLSDHRRFGNADGILDLLMKCIADDGGLDVVQNLATCRSEAPHAKKSIKAIAFYLPQYHPIPENDSWWGAGFTEWTNTTRARPLFRHHHQPQLPADLGYYDLRLPEVQLAQAQLAKEYGLHGFCYYYYWFNGKKILNRPIEQMLESGEPGFPYCICWANENWSRNWDGQNRHILLKQSYSGESNRQLIRELLKHFKDRRYIRHDGKPVLIVYRIRIIPNWRAIADMWREECRAAGIGEIHLCAVRFGLEPLDGHPSDYGLDSYVLFPPHETNKVDARQSVMDLAKDFNGEILHYDAAIDGDLSRFQDGYPWPVHRGAMLGWDNTARRQKDSRIFTGATPSRFRAWLSGIACQDAEHSPNTSPMVFINAWNEWAEGTTLEPSSKFGHGYLQAFSSVIAPSSDGRRNLNSSTSSLKSRVETKWRPGKQIGIPGAPRVLLCAHVVSHELFGAERSFFDMLAALSTLPVNVIVALPTDVHDEYTQQVAQHANQVVILPYRQWRNNRPPDAGIVQAFEQVVEAAAVDCVYTNTIVLMEPLVAAKNLNVPAATHARELIDQDKQLTDYIGLDANEIAEQVIGWTDLVIANSEATFKLYNRPGRTFKAPNVVCGGNLDIPNVVSSNGPVFGIVSSNLPKKGVPEFIELARLAHLRQLRAKFVVIGPGNGFVQEWQKQDVPPNLEFLGYRKSPKEAMQELNVLLSLSRFAESFGRTAAEAQAARRPVIAYNRGAIPELVLHGETGFLVAADDLDGVLSYVERFCSEPWLITTMGDTARNHILRNFSPETLRHNLVPPLKQAFAFSRPVPEAMKSRPVAVIIPVYNAAEATRACLESVQQHLDTSKERVIIINDGSTDAGIAPLLSEYSGRAGFEIVHNGENLGYTRTINKGIRLAGDDDVVLLNSDTVVTAGWLRGLREAAYARSNIATSTAMSDNAGAFSFPAENRPNPKPDGVSHEGYACQILERTRKLDPVEVPTGSGFCMYIRRDAFNRLGEFDEEAFPRGYGEENDFCMRAVRCGWTHVIAPGAFVFHVRTASFGAEKDLLIKAAVDKVTSRYPEYAQMVRAAFGSDAMKALRLAASGQAASEAASLVVTGRGAADDADL